MDTEESAEDIGTPLSPFEVLETMFGIYAGKSEFVARVYVDVRGMGAQTFKLFTKLPTFLPAIAEGSAFLKNLAGSNEAIERLATRAINNTERYVKAMLVNDPATCNAVSRDLMELEALILDFTFDSSRIALWLEQNESSTKDFAFGTLNKRLKKATGIDKHFATPSYSEYMMHSEHLHVRPESWNFSSGNPDTDLFILCLELSEHLFRVCVAIINFNNPGVLDQESIDELEEQLSQLINFHQLSHKLFTTAKEDLMKEGFEFPDRTIYRISDFPRGIRIIPVDNDEKESNSGEESEQ